MPKVERRVRETILTGKSCEKLFVKEAVLSFHETLAKNELSLIFYMNYPITTIFYFNSDNFSLFAYSRFSAFSSIQPIRTSNCWALLANAPLGSDLQIRK